MKRTDNGQMLNKKKSKSKSATICLQSCNSSIVHDVAKSMGLEIVKSYSSAWDLYWSNTPMDTKELENLKKYQKTNHFPGISEICRKDFLARNLNTMAKYFKEDYNFFPQTWQLPSDHAKLQAYMNHHKTSTFIVKPSSGSRGTGIYLIKHLKKISIYEQTICQLYISNSMLMDGYKFDIRVYTLIASCDPLKIYVYNDGLVRLATVPYTKPTGSNMNDSFMHLTNYSVNRYSERYVDHEIVGSKRRIATLNESLGRNGHDVKKMWDKIDDAIIKTIILAYPRVSHNYKTCFTGHLHTQACFEILGFDVILDENCKPYILEVNRSPDFHTSTSIDKIVKRQLLMDTFKLLQLDKTYKNVAFTEEKWKTRQRVLNVDKDVLKQRKIDCKIKYEQQNNEWESQNMGNYRLVFSEKNRSSYERFFYRNENKLYQNTYRPSLSLLPVMSSQEQLRSKQIKKTNDVERKKVISQTNRIKNQYFIRKNVYTLTASNKIMSVVNKTKESIIPVIPHFKVDSSIKKSVRNKTTIIKSMDNIIIKGTVHKKFNQLQNELSKKSLRQEFTCVLSNKKTNGAVESSNSYEMIKIKNKKKFPNVQSYLFNKHIARAVESSNSHEMIKNENKQKCSDVQSCLNIHIGVVKGLNSYEMIKSKNKKKFPNIQSCLFKKHFKKKTCFSIGWESEINDQIEENYRIDNMIDRAENVFKLGVKESIYNAFEKLKNIYEIDRVDYMEYKQKRELLGHKAHTYTTVNINVHGTSNTSQLDDLTMY